MRVFVLTEENKKNFSDFYKNSKKNKIWEISEVDENDCEILGGMFFSFDKKTVFNFWEDYPEKLTKEQVEIFKKEFHEMARLK